MAETPGRLRLLRGTTAQWTAANPVLAAGEIGYDTTANVVKIGNGSSTWSALAGIGGTGGGTTDHGLLTGLSDDDHPQYALLADAAALSDTTPLTGVQNGFAGTAITASRGDHRHPIPSTTPTIAYTTNWCTPQKLSGSNPFTINRLCVVPYWISVRDNRPIVISAMGLHVATAGSSDSTFEVAFYASQAIGWPDLTQKLVSGTITTGATTGDKFVTLGSNYTFTTSPILVWAATLPHGTTCPAVTTVDITGQLPRLESTSDGAMAQEMHLSATGLSVLPTTQIGLAAGNEAPPALFIKPV